MYTNRVATRNLALCSYPETHAVFSPEGDGGSLFIFPGKRARSALTYKLSRSFQVLTLPDKPLFAFRFCCASFYTPFIGRDGTETPLPLVVRDGVAGEGGFTASSRVLRGTGRVPGGIHLRRG